MVKFDSQSSMKQYVKNKPIKSGFKFLYRCASGTAYLYQFDWYLSKKESAEENLEPGVVFEVTESFQNNHCMVFI